MRARIRQAHKNTLLNKFKNDEVSVSLQNLFKNHYIKNYLETDVQLLAFIDHEIFKEILLKSSFLPKFDINIKLRNILYYIMYPSHIEDFGGIIILRNPDDMGKDEEEFQIILKKETLKVKGFTYISDKLQTINPQYKDTMEITLDLFIWDNFKMVFKGVSSEKKFEFRIPSYNYQLMVNIRFIGKDKKNNLQRKALFDCKFLHRKETNYADVKKELNIDYKFYINDISNVEKTGKFGLYII